MPMKDKTVVIALEFRAIIMALGMLMLLSETLVGYQLFPFHIIVLLDSVAQKYTKVSTNQNKI